MSPDYEPEWIITALEQARGEAAPARLREQVDRMGAGRSRRTRRPRRPWTLATGALIAGLVAVVGFVLADSGPDGPTVARAAELVARLPAGPGSGSSAVPTPGYGSFTGVRFPSQLSGGHWQYSGGGIVNLANRRILALDYRDGGRQLIYAIASTPVLADQHTGFTSFRAADQTVISWQRAGHSCLLLSADISASSLRALAAS